MEEAEQAIPADLVPRRLNSSLDSKGGMIMNKAIVAIVVSVMVIGCATIPTTAVYRQDEGQISQTIYVLPVTDTTPQRHIDDATLASLRKHLIKTLKASGQFISVYETMPANNQQEVTYVRCKVSQFDTSARRMAIVTELFKENSDRPFLRLVTHSELVSIAWPIDYVGVMERAGKTVVEDAVKQMVRSMENK